MLDEGGGGMEWGQADGQVRRGDNSSPSSNSGLPTASIRHPLGLVKASQDWRRHSVGLQCRLEPHPGRQLDTWRRQWRENCPFQVASPFPSSKKKGIVKAAKSRPSSRSAERRELQFAVVIGPETLLILEMAVLGPPGLAHSSSVHPRTSLDQGGLHHLSHLPSAGGWTKAQRGQALKRGCWSPGSHFPASGQEFLTSFQRVLSTHHTLFWQASPSSLLSRTLPLVVLFLLEVNYRYSAYPWRHLHASTR